MERRPATSFGNEFMRKFRYFKTELNLFFTYRDLNITCVLILSFLTDWIALLLQILEPFSVVCLDFWQVIPLFSIITFYEYTLIVVITILIFLFAGLGVFQNQILVLWLHAPGIFLFSYMILSMTSCFADIEMPRPAAFSKYYELHPKQKGYVGPKECFNEMNNCHRSYFTRLMTVLMLSVVVGLWHSVVFGIRAWKRLSTMPHHHASPLSRPAMFDDFDEEPLSLDSYRADSSSLPTSDVSAAKPAKERSKRVLDPRRKLVHRTSSKGSSKSSES